MKHQAKWVVVCASLSALTLVLALACDSRTVADKDAPRLTVDRVAGFSRSEIRGMREDMVTERDAVVTGLLRMLSDRKNPDALRLAAIEALGSLATREALNYCIDNIDLMIATESGEDDPDLDYPCVRALRSAGWSSVPLLLERGQRVGVGEKKLMDCGRVLVRICGPSMARALLRERHHQAREPAKSSYAVMLEALR